MSKLHVNLSPVAVDLEKNSTECGSVESKTALFVSACENIFSGE